MKRFFFQLKTEICVYKGCNGLYMIQKYSWIVCVIAAYHWVWCMCPVDTLTNIERTNTTFFLFSFFIRPSWMNFFFWCNISTCADHAALYSQLTSIRNQFHFDSAIIRTHSTLIQFNKWDINCWFSRTVFIE